MKARREALAPPVALFAALCGRAPLGAMAVVSVARIEGYTLALALGLRAWRAVAALPVMRGLIGQAVFHGAILACLTPLAAYPIAAAGCVAAPTLLVGRARRSARRRGKI